MFSRWYLILFIISIIFLLFVGAFNIYEQDRIKRKCKQCEENQEMLLILNGIAMFLTLLLFFGYFFSQDSSSKQNTSKTPSTSIQPSSSYRIAPQSSCDIVNPFSCTGTIDIVSKI
jgi:uncharacterized protein YneF (UPF0154 family)